jgi:hypothetical protein
MDVLDQIESEKNLTGRSKTDVVIDRLRNSIPSLAVTDRQKLPAIAAIYQVFTSNNNLLYIGITDNLKQDWESHPLYGQFLESDVNSRITWYNSDLPVIDPNLVKKLNSVSDTVNTDRDSHSENMVSSDQLEYAIANSEIIQSLEGFLYEKLDESIAKLASCFSRRLLGLEKRLDDMERLLRLQREASIATSPIPTGETSHDQPDRPAIEPAIDTLPVPIQGTDEPVETDSSIETVTGAIEDSEKKIPLQNTLIGSPIGIDEIVSTDSSIEPVTDAIETDDREWLTLQQIADKKITGLPGTHQGLSPYAENWESRKNPKKRGKQYKIPREYL